MNGCAVDVAFEYDDIIDVALDFDLLLLILLTLILLLLVLTLMLFFFTLGDVLYRRWFIVLLFVLIHLLVYAFPLANWLFSPTLSEKFLLWEMGVEPVVGWIDSYMWRLSRQLLRQLLRRGRPLALVGSANKALSKVKTRKVCPDAVLQEIRPLFHTYPSYCDSYIRMSTIDSASRSSILSQ